MPVAANNNKSSSQQQRHPCVRVYKDGLCFNGTNCKFRNYPRNCCLTFLKSGVCNNNKCHFKHIAFTGVNPATSTLSTAGHGPQVILYNNNDDELTTKNRNPFSARVNDDDVVSEAESRVSNSVLFAAAENVETTILNNEKEEEEPTKVPNSSLASSAPAVAAASAAAVSTTTTTSRTVETKDSCTSIDEEINMKSAENRLLTAGLKYKMHTLQTRFDAMNAKVISASTESERIKGKIAEIEAEQERVVAQCKAEYAARFEAEAKKHEMLSAKMIAVDRAASVEIHTAQQVCEFLKTMLRDTGSDLVAEANKKATAAASKTSSPSEVMNAFVEIMNNKLKFLNESVDVEAQKLKHTTVN